LHSQKGGFNVEHDGAAVPILLLVRFAKGGKSGCVEGASTAVDGMRIACTPWGSRGGRGYRSKEEEGGIDQRRRKEV
jgi:hypothetical protein